MKVTVEFGYDSLFMSESRGGMDVLFNNRKKLDLNSTFQTIQDLILYLKENELSERVELFVDGNELY